MFNVILNNISPFYSEVRSHLSKLTVDIVEN